MSEYSPTLAPSVTKPFRPEVRTPEQKVMSVITTVNNLLIQQFGEEGINKLEGRQQACEYATTLVDRAAKLNGGMATIYQVGDVHNILGERKSDLPFRHGFTIVRFDQQAYLVDLTYCQFMYNNGRVQQGKQPTRFPTHDSFVQTIYKRGYIPLTDISLQNYLRRTTLNPTPRYVNKISVKDLNRVAAHPYDYDSQELQEIDTALKQS